MKKSEVVKTVNSALEYFDKKDKTMERDQINSVTKCPTCGSTVNVAGDDKEGTQNYIPIESQPLSDERIEDIGFDCVEGKNHPNIHTCSYSKSEYECDRCSFRFQKCASLVKSDAEEFGEWLPKNTLSFGKNPKTGQSVYIMEDGTLKTTSELYSIFQEQQKKK